MSNQPWHKRYHSDALTGFMSLTLEERGAFQTLLDLIYDRGGPIINNDRLLAGYMGVSLRKWAALRDTLVSKCKITIEDGHITNSRAIFEIEKSLKTSRKHAENGSKGGHKSGETRKNANENNDSDQAGLERGSSLIRYQIPEEANASNAGAGDDAVSRLAHEITTGTPMATSDWGQIEQQKALVSSWLLAGADAGLIRDTVTDRLAKAGSPPGNLRWFDKPVREAVERRKADASRVDATTDAIMNRVLGRSAA